MATNLYDLKYKLSMVGAQLKDIETKLVNKVADPDVPIKEIQDLKAERGELQERFNTLKDAHDKLDAAEKARLDALGQDPIAGAKTDKARIIAAKAEFIRAKVENREMAIEAKEILAADVTAPLIAIPKTSDTNKTGGAALLPTTQDKELIHEPFATNPLRGKISMTSIAGLELPKIAFSLDDDDFIADTETAKEIKLKGDKIEFGKNKFKVKVRISDTVLHGSDLELVSYVENALRSGLAAKERKVSFAHGSDGSPLPVVAAEKHMSLYEVDGSDFVIKEVSGAGMYEAITNAIADLHEDYRERAQVCMRYSDYVTMLKELANQSVPLYGKQPEEIIGKPVFFSDAAAIKVEDAVEGRPIIGNFSYLHLNYDPSVVYDSDKDVDKGEYIWVLTAWIDQHKKLASAFRIAKNEPEEA